MLFNTTLPKAKEIQRIACLCYGGLGDVLLFAPVLAELKAWLPEANIVLYVEQRSMGVASIIEGADSFQSIPTQLKKHQLFAYLATDLRKRHFDAVLITGSHPLLAWMIGLSGVAYRVGYHSGDTWLAQLTRPSLSVVAPLRKELYASDMHLELAKAFLSPIIGPAYHVKTPEIRPLAKAVQQRDLEAIEGCFPSEPFDPLHVHELPKVLIHPGVSQMSLKKGIHKTWSASQWAQFILKLSQTKRVFLVGGKEDAPLIDEIIGLLPDRLSQFKNCFGKTQSMNELLALMQRMDVVCCVDSAPMHASLALNQRTVALFGPTNPELLFPKNNPRFKAVFREELACRPCLWATRQANCASSECLSVSVEAMVEAVDAVLFSDSTP